METGEVVALMKCTESPLKRQLLREKGKELPTMAELLVKRYAQEVDWACLERKTARPENDRARVLSDLKARAAG